VSIGVTIGFDALQREANRRSVKVDSVVHVNALFVRSEKVNCAMLRCGLKETITGIVEWIADQTIKLSDEPDIHDTAEAVDRYGGGNAGSRGPGDLRLCDMLQNGTDGLARRVEFEFDGTGSALQLVGL